MFDIHKIKPVHGWREFFGEVGIIVLGVLIALAAEALVERLHWRHQVAAGRETLKRDAENFLGNAVEREAESACLGRRFSEVARIIDSAAASGRLPAIGRIANPPSREWHFGSWESLVSSQITTHMSRDDLTRFSELVENAAYVDTLNRKELDDWSILYTIVGPGRRFNRAEEPLLRQALVRALYDAKLIRIVSHETQRSIESSGLLSGAEVRRAETLPPTAVHPILCQPIGPAADAYDQAPFKYDLSKAADQD